MKSVPNPTSSPSDKVVAKAIAELQSGFKKMQIEQSKQMRLLQNEWKKQMKAITIQNNKALEILNKIAKNSPNVNAFNEGIKAIQKMNTSGELAKAVSKINTDLISEMNKYFNNLNLSSQLSSQIEKAVKEYNQSDAMTKPLMDFDWSKQFNEMMEKFNQEWKSYLDNALPFREYGEKNVEQKDTQERSEDKENPEIEDEKEYH
jgi:hypothetical protein